VSRICQSVFIAFVLSWFSTAMLGTTQVPDQITVTINLRADSQASFKELDDAIKESFLLDRLTYESDVCFQDAEFHYLVGLQEDTVVSVDDIKKAVSYLAKKNKFQTISLVLKQEGPGKHLHIRLAGHWTFQKLKLTGLLIGKENYRQYYLMRSGDVFDETKHRHSLEKIKDVFKDEGYFDGRVSGSFDYDHATKSVLVTIVLDRGDKFTIGNIDLVIRAGNNADADEFDFLKAQVHKLFLRRLRLKPYAKKLLNKETQALKRYLAKKAFINTTIRLQETIKRSKRQVDLTFIIDLHQKKEFVFFGNYFFSSAQLLDNILQFGRSAWMLPPSILSEELVRAYHKKGFWTLQVEPKEEEDRVFFLIKEGLRASVKKVELKDAKNFNATFLIKKAFSDFLKLKYFDEAVLKQALNALVSLYLKEGFLDITVVKHDFVPLDGNLYKLVVTLDEGERSYITSVSIEEFKELESQGPFRRFQKKALPIPFDIQILDEQRRWLVAHFHKAGYLHAQIKPGLIWDQNKVAIIWKIDQGSSKVTFGKTVITGSTTFPFEKILRELTYKEGEIWEKEKLKESSLKLRELNIFEHIHLYPYQVAQSDFSPAAPGEGALAKAEKEKAIILKLQKDDPFEIRVRAGLALQHFTKHFTIDGLTYRVGSSLFVKNPFNSGDQLIVDTDFARPHRKFVVEYLHPWFFKVPLRTSWKGYSNRYNQPGFVGSPKNLYRVTQEGLLVGMSRQHNHFDGGLNCGVEWMETKIKKEDADVPILATQIAKAINFSARVVDKKIPFFLIEPTVLFNYLDNKLDPTIGSFTLFSLKGMFPLRGGSQTHFVKVLMEQSLFTPLGRPIRGRPVVFGVRLRFGHIFHQAFSAIMPTERFYLGGANSIRSYETDLCPPLGCFEDRKGKTHFVPQGGKTMMNLNAELRIPTFNNSGAVIFQDLGILIGDSFQDFKNRKLLAASGFGLRYKTPIGPLRFDVAWKWHTTNPWELNYAWFLSLGHAF